MASVSEGQLGLAFSLCLMSVSQTPLCGLGKQPWIQCAAFSWSVDLVEFRVT